MSWVKEIFKILSAFCSFLLRVVDKVAELLSAKPSSKHIFFPGERPTQKPFMALCIYSSSLYCE